MCRFHLAWRPFLVLKTRFHRLSVAVSGGREYSGMLVNEAPSVRGMNDRCRKGENSLSVVKRQRLSKMKMGILLRAKSASEL